MVRRWEEHRMHTARAVGNRRLPQTNTIPPPPSTAVLNYSELIDQIEEIHPGPAKPHPRAAVRREASQISERLIYP
jgi:hypothetical protein